MGKGEALEVGPLQTFPRNTKAEPHEGIALGIYEGLLPLSGRKIEFTYIWPSR